MSYININSDLFLGSQELNRFIKSLDADGFRKLFLKDAISFGFFNNSKAGNFDNFLVQQGTNVGSIKHNEGFAIDSDGLIIHKDATDNIALTNDSNWYWLKISHAYSPTETGTVSIDKSGNLTGSGTEFETILRGLPNNPSRIFFPNSVLNLLEYDVVEVINQSAALLAGDFLAESNLQYQIVGTFTPDIVVPTNSKFPFQYDSCTFSLVLETVSDTPPTSVVDKEFFVARVKRSGATITIQDKRKSYIYRNKSDYLLNNILSSTNPLIGVEQITYDNKYAPRNENLVQIAWGMRSSNWTIDSSINRLTIIGGNGGKFKSTADFTDGNFDGWRVYTKSGKYSIIKQSSISALQINLILDTLDADEYSDTTQEVHIVPDSEEIEIIANVPNGQSILTQKRFTYPINEGYAKLPLEVYATVSCQYTISYRNKNLSVYSQETLIPDDITSGYYIETAFDADGTLTGSSKSTYGSGVITLLESPSSYRSTIAILQSRDLFGLELLSLSNVSPNNVNDFVVGSRKQNVIVTQDPDLSDSHSTGPFDFSINQFINLRTDEGFIVGGNSFIVEFQGNYVKGAYNLYIVQDWVSVVDPGTVLYTFTNDDYTEAQTNNLFFRFIYDADNGIWIVNRFVSSTLNVITDGSITPAKLSVTVVQSPDNVQLFTKVVNIGDWNMDTTESVVIAHGLSDFTKIRSVSVIIRDDADANYYPLDRINHTINYNNSIDGGFYVATSTDIVLARVTGVGFDGVNFDSTGYNRGFITIIYAQ